jgi:hypothetical protein
VTAGDPPVHFMVRAAWPAWELEAGDVLELRWGRALVRRRAEAPPSVRPLNCTGLLWLWEAGVLEPITPPPGPKPGRRRPAPGRCAA